MANFSCMGIGCSRTFNDSRALKTHTQNCYAYKREAKRRLRPASPVPTLVLADNVNLEAEEDPGDVDMGPILPVSKKIHLLSNYN